MQRRGPRRGRAGPDLRRRDGGARPRGPERRDGRGVHDAHRARRDNAPRRVRHGRGRRARGRGRRAPQAAGRRARRDAHGPDGGRAPRPEEVAEPRRPRPARVVDGDDFRRSGAPHGRRGRLRAALDPRGRVPGVALPARPPRRARARPRVRGDRRARPLPVVAVRGSRVSTPSPASRAEGRPLPLERYALVFCGGALLAACEPKNGGDRRLRSTDVLLLLNFVESRRRRVREQTVERGVSRTGSRAGRRRRRSR